jgi:hypothetical protein
VADNPLDIMCGMSARSGTDKWESEGLEMMSSRQDDGVLDRELDRVARCPPEKPNASDMNDPPERQGPGTGQHGSAERKYPMAAQFTKGLCPTATLDLTRDSLGEEKPPGKDIPVPGVDDHVNVLVEEIAVDELDSHSRCNAKRAEPIPATTSPDANTPAGARVVLPGTSNDALSCNAE